MRKKLKIGLLAVLGFLGIGLLVAASKLGYGPLAESNAVRIYHDEPVHITGKFDRRDVDLGPEPARQLHTLLSRATSPGRNKCAELGDVTLHYASGKSVDIQVGCCTAWINGKSWHVGGDAMRKFFEAQQ